MNWIQTGTALTALVGTVYVGVTTLATKEEVKEKVGVVDGKVMVVQNQVDRHVIDDEIFYTNRRIWQIKNQEKVRECETIQQVNQKDECRRLELKVDRLEDQKEALAR